MRKFLAVITFVFLSYSLLFSQNRPGIIQNYTIWNGLPSNTVLDILSDSSGFIWISSLNGLLKYDGYFFSKVSTDPSIASRNLTALFYYRNRVLLNTSDFKVFSYDPVEERCRLVFSHGNIIRIDPRNQIWLQYKDSIILYSDIDSGTILKGCTVKSENELLDTFAGIRLPGQEIFQCMHTLRSGQCLVGTNHGVCVYDPGTKVLRSYPLQDFDPVNMWRLVVNRIFEDSRGTIWIGTKYLGLYAFDISTGHYTKHPGNEIDLTKIGNSITAVTEDYCGNIWVALTDGGLYKINYLQKKFRITEIVKKDGFPDMITAVFQDGQDNIWMGTADNGIYKKTRKGDIVHYECGPSGAGIAGNGWVRDIKQDEKGNVWSVNYDGYVNKFTPAGSIVNYKGADNDLYGWSFGAVLPDSHDGLWLGSQKGLEYYNSVTKQRELYKSIEEDKNSKVWGNIWSLSYGYSNRIWAGTHRYIYYFDTVSKTFTALPQCRINNKECEISRVMSIREVLPGIVWFTTEGYGLFKYDMHTGKYLHFDKSDGLPNNKLYGLLPDSNGRLWISSESGLACFDTSDYSIKIYDAADGLMSNQFSWTSACRLNDGQLCFGGYGGMVSFYPDSIQDSKITPRIYISGMKINGMTVHPGDTVNSRILLRKSITCSDTLTLQYKDKVVSFDFVLLHYSSPLKFMYSYWMEGFDKEWISVDAGHRYVTYTNIPAGKYFLHLKGRNGDGVWSNERQLLIVVLPPWWQTLWFRITFVILIILLLITIYQYRTRKIRLENIKLENTVKERTSQIEEQKNHIQQQSDVLKEVNVQLFEQKEELQDLNEELKAQAEELNVANSNLQLLNATKDKFFSIIAHDLKNPFQGIMGLSENLELQFDSLNDPQKKEFIAFIKDASKGAYSLLENLLQWSRSQTNSITFTPVLLSIAEIVHETFTVLRLNADNKNIRLISQISEELKVIADKNMITTVIRNLVNNAIKFTGKDGQIRISQVFKDNQVLIKVSDTGVGITDDQLKKMFRIDTHKSTVGTSGESGTGLGLILCKEFVEKNSGTLSVESEPGKGSTFIISLPAAEGVTIPIIETKEEKREEHTREMIKPQVPEESTPVYDTEEFRDSIILIVEDSEPIRLNIKSYLEKYFTVYDSPDGQAGYDHAVNTVPDLIISDVLMPNLDGFALCEKLKSDMRTSHIPVVLLTTLDSDMKKVQGLNKGADDYLTKPFSNEVLKARVYNLLRSRKSLWQNFATRYLVLQDNLVDENDAFLKKAQDFVHINIDRSHITPEEFAAALNMGRAQFYRKVKQVTGYSVSIFIRVIRLKKAADLLKSTNLSINEIAYSTGFEYTQNFSRYFMEYFTMSPSDFRKR